MKIPAAAVAAAFAVLAAVLASTALSGGGSTDSKVACGNEGWATTAAGKPAALSSGQGRSFYVWRDATGWRLRALGVSRSAPLSGQVQADTQLRAVATSRSVRSGLRTHARSVSFRLSSARLSGLDLRSPCATRLSFRLKGNSGPRVYLGSRGKAPAAAFRLNRPAAAGVAGRILLGSRCPVVGHGCPPAKPTEATVRIETAPAEKGSPGHVVATVRSDANGNYSADVSPGRYLLVVEKSRYPAQKAYAATVEGGVVTLTDLFLNTGIR